MRCHTWHQKRAVRVTPSAWITVGPVQVPVISQKLFVRPTSVPKAFLEVLGQQLLLEWDVIGSPTRFPHREGTLDQPVVISLWEFLHKASGTLAD